MNFTFIRATVSNGHFFQVPRVAIVHRFDCDCNMFEMQLIFFQFKISQKGLLIVFKSQVPKENNLLSVLLLKILFFQTSQCWLQELHFFEIILIKEKKKKLFRK
jgi:hypothetical protein